MNGQIYGQQQPAWDQDQDFTQCMREFIQDRRIRERMVAERFMESILREPAAQD